MSIVPPCTQCAMFSTKDNLRVHNPYQEVNISIFCILWFLFLLCYHWGTPSHQSIHVAWPWTFVSIPCWDFCRLWPMIVHLLPWWYYPNRNTPVSSLWGRCPDGLGLHADANFESRVESHLCLVLHGFALVSNNERATRWFERTELEGIHFSHLSNVLLMLVLHSV